MGRPRKPTMLKIVAGTDRRAGGASREPTPAAAAARRQAPKHLSRDGAAAWRRMAPLCRGMGTLTVADLPAFERMCETWAEIRRLDRALIVLGSTTYECATKAEGIMRRPHPEVGQRSDAERRFLAYLSQFGLTPAARSKVSTSGAGGQTDAGSRFFS